MSLNHRCYSFADVSQQTGVPVEHVISYIERKWIMPADEKNPDEPLDHEDLARIHLIVNLQHDFGVNDDAVPIILHLVDQLNCMRNRLRS